MAESLDGDARDVRALTPTIRTRLRGVPYGELALVALAALAYFGIRNATVGNAKAAFDNALAIVRFERAHDLDWEAALQAEVTARAWLVTVANWVYIWGHWPVIIVAAILLHHYRRDRYYLLRNAMFVSAAIGFTFFVFFPVAPPRLLDLGLVDTVTEQSNSYRALQPPGLTNQFAAFPSLHAGWNILLGIVAFGSTARLLIRALSLVGPALMVLAVVVTANHFVVDVAGGAIVVAIGLLIAKLLPPAASASDAPRHVSGAGARGPDRRQTEDRTTSLGSR